jgi:hypothetical protein
MNKLVGLLVAGGLACGVQAMAFDEDRFRSTLESFNRVALPPVAGSIEKGMPTGGSGPKGGQNQSNDDFVWLKADKINQQLELIIRGIEGAKGVATALAVITNLYNSDKISIDVALTAVQLLKLRATFLKVFVTNGDTELEIMINVLNDQEAELAGKKGAQAAKPRISVGARGKISNPPQGQVPSPKADPATQTDPAPQADPVAPADPALPDSNSNF